MYIYVYIYIYIYNFNQNLKNSVLLIPQHTYVCCYHNILMYVVAYLIAACFKEIFVSTPWSWRGNAGTCRSCIRHSVHQLLNSAFLGLAWFIFYLKLQCSWITSCNLLDEYQSWWGTWCVLFRLGVEEVIEGSPNIGSCSGVCLVCPVLEPPLSGQVVVSWAGHRKVTSFVNPTYSLFKTLYWCGCLDASLGLRKGYCSARSPFPATKLYPTVLWLTLRLPD